MSGISTILLVGGLGTRMGPDVDGRPKALVEIGGRPVLWHLMKLYSTYGHTHFVLPLGYRGDLFRRYFLEYEALTHDFHMTLGRPDLRDYLDRNREADWEVTLIDAGLATNKSGRVQRAADHVRGDTFFVTYGDGIGDVDLKSLLEFHRGHGRLATLTGFRPHSQYGLLEVEGDRVRSIREKPRLNDWINAGFFVFERPALAYFAGGEAIDLERDTLPRLAADDQLRIWRHEGFWASMDTFKEAQVLNDVWNRGAPWKVWEE